MYRKRRYVNNDPRIIKAKFNSSCTETGKPIKLGDECVYYPIGKAIYSIDSKQAYIFRCEKADGFI